jgi:hypothetical protein
MKKTLLLFAILAGASQLSVNAQDSWYSFNKDFKDSLNTANVAETTGDIAIVFDAVRNSNVAAINETSNDAGFITLPAEIMNTETLTVSCWAAYTNPTGAGNWGRFWDFGVDNKNYLMLSYTEGDNFKPTLDITVSGTAGGRAQSPSAIVSGEWHHYVVTYGDGFSRLYMDGAEVSYVENTASLKDIFNAGACTNYIGKSHWPDLALVGRVDDMRTFNRVLTADDVAKLYDGTFTSTPKVEAASAEVFAKDGAIVVDLKDNAAKGSISVFDVVGKAVSTTSSLSAVNTITVPAKGVYVVKLVLDGSTSTSKVVVK